MNAAFLKTPDSLLVHPAIGFTSVATMVAAAGHHTVFVDLSLSGYPFERLHYNQAYMAGLALNWEAVEKDIAATDAHAYFITASFTRYLPETFRTARLIRKHHPGALIVAGGVHASYLPLRTLEECAEIDAVVIGEGEHAAVAILETVKHNKPLETVPGLACRINGKATLTGGCGFEPLLDDLPSPDRRLWPEREYRTVWKHLFEGRDPLGLIMTSRGCVGRCLFCASGKRQITFNKLRFRSPGSVLEELQMLITDFHITSVDVLDDCLTLNKPLLPELCEFISRHHLPWVCKSRIDKLDLETIRLLKKHGCERVFVGMESGDDNILQQMGKHVDMALIRRVSRDLMREGLDFSASFTVGHPGETEASIRKTTDFASSLARRGKRVGIYLITPYPGSALYDSATEHGWLLPCEWHEFDQSASGKPIYAPDGWTPEQLQASYRRAWKKVYQAHVQSFLLHPGTLLLKLKGKGAKALIKVFTCGIVNAARRLWKRKK